VNPANMPPISFPSPIVVTVGGWTISFRGWIKLYTPEALRTWPSLQVFP
jgi:hypothetical protein